MADLLQERTISGKGVLKFDKITDPTYRVLLLYIDVVRYPQNEYKNFKHNPYQSFYANCAFVRNGYVVEKRQIEYTTELWKFVPDIAGQTLIALKCHLDAVFQSIINLGLSLGSPPISVENPIAGYPNLTLEADELRFVCYSSAAIRFRLYGVKYETCNVEYNTQESGGEPPPPEPGKFPIDEPVTVDKPYEEDDSDNGDTQPYPDDRYPDETPVGGECEIVQISGNLQYDLPDTTTINFDFSVQVWGIVESYEIRQPVDVNSPNTGGLFVFARGLINDGGCAEPQDVRVVSPNSSVVEPGSVVVTNLTFQVL